MQRGLKDGEIVALELPSEAKLNKPAKPAKGTNAKRSGDAGQPATAAKPGEKTGEKKAVL